MSDSTGRLRFPRLHAVTLRQFSLYCAQPEISVEVNDGVFCLAGANGIGKTTFLSAVNFGFTGRVAEPERKFESVGEYYNERVSYSEHFFDGRIAEADRELAEVELEFSVGARVYRLVRGAFEPTGLRDLSIDQGGADDKDAPDTAALDPQERQKLYEDYLKADVGVPTFEHFVFLQHFVLTFDEQRRLLFWDRPVLETALFLAFAVGHADVEAAGKLRRDSQKLDSRARNRRWQASRVRDRLKSLEQTADALSAEAEGLAEQHEALQRRVDEREAEVQRLTREQRDAELALGRLSAEAAAAREAYQEVFSRTLGEGTPPARHPVVVSSLANQACELCGADGASIAEAIRERASAGTCPLCGSEHDRPRPGADALAQLEQVNEGLTKLNALMGEARLRLQRLTDDLQGAHEQLRSAQGELGGFLDQNREPPADLVDLPTEGRGLALVLDAYRTQMRDFNSEADDAYKERDKARRELQKLQRKLERRYEGAEEQFVPAFRNLAGRFLGLDLDIHLDRRDRTSLALIAEVERARRHEAHQLSESQRLFLDIALRMALAQYMSDPECGAALYIDTPEGSLDIAYESRAGAMFADFVASGHRILMTANINTSELLFRLAEQCGHERMQLCRMTEWAELSDVQRAEEARMNAAYEQIEQRLRSGSTD